MNGNEPIPYAKCDLGVAVCDLVANHIDVSTANRGQDATEDRFDAGSSVEGTGKRFRAALRVGFNSAAQFGKGRIEFSLAQQEIAIAPRSLGRARIGAPGVEEGVPRTGDVGF